MKPSNQVDQRSNSRSFRFGSIVLILLAFAGMAILAPRFRGKNPTPLEKFERDVRLELPVGSTRDELRAWAQNKDLNVTFREYDLATLPAPPAKTLPEISGIPREELKSFAEVVMDWGAFKLWRTREIAANKLWFFVSFDENGLVRGHYFLTLEGLAEYERQRDTGR